MPLLLLVGHLTYGGGAGVAAGFAVFGGGKDVFEFLKYGFPYVALNLGSTLKPFCRSD